MPGLQKKLIDYMNIVGYTMHYEFESTTTLNFTFEKNSFPHMAGLHKLRDIPLIQQFNNPNNKMICAKYLISKIKKGALTENDVKNSCYYGLIEQRYHQFTSENLFSMTYTDVIIDFNVTRLVSSKLLHTKYILYEKEKTGYRQLCIAINASGECYAETFFFEPSDNYIKGQTHEKIHKVQMIAPDGTIYFEDSF